MDKKKQIEKMGQDMYNLLPDDDVNWRDCENAAEGMFDQGYRKQEWISAEEHTPDEDGEYIVAYHPCFMDAVRYGELRVGIDTFRDSGWERRKFQRVTHWMNKPDLPKTKGAKNEEN